MAIEQVLKDLGAATAYAYAVEKGYTGTEAEFAELMASYASVAQSAAASATAAAGSATSAASSASTASAAATTATTKASEASTSATNAAGSASSAASSATAASGSATSAAASATTASGKASEAATAATTATTAKTDAVAAKTAAQTAQTAAETAQGLAEDAQAAAEDAAESVSASAAQIATNTSDISDLKENLNQKANQDGYYADLVSGGSTQLLSDMVETDTMPYNYRTAGGSLEIGDRMKLKKIVGGSLAVNQLARSLSSFVGQNATIAVSDGVATLTASGSVTYVGLADSGPSVISPIGGHKYLMTAKINGPNNSRINFSYGNSIGLSGYAAGDVWKEISGILTQVSPTGQYIQLRVFASFAAADVVSIKDLMVIDLTLMFGTTIADYVYSLETATAGAGVAWLKAHFPRIFDAGYIPYNAGTLEHVSGLSAHKMVGFNQWDEEWESGTNDGYVTESTIHSKNFCKILPNTTYYATCGKMDGGNQNRYYLRILFYDANKNFISAGYYNNLTFTTPENAAYFKLETNTSTVVYGNVYNHDICINLHWDGERDGEYEPYEEHSYPLDSDVTLRGIPKLDANNNLYYDGDEYEADGTVTRQYREVVFNGTENWGIESSSWNSHGLNAFYIVLGAGNQAYFPSASDMPMLICDKFVGASNTSLKTSDKTGLIGFVGGSGSANYIEILSDATDVASFKTWLANNNTKVVYKLITPTTEEADTYTEIQNVSNWGTEEFVSESLVPVGHETEYQPDLRAKIEVAPESPDTDGLYLMKRENGQNSYVAYLGELPSDPTTDGTYTLKCTVASGTATKTWEADT